MDDSMIVDLFLKRDEDAIKQVTIKYGRLLRSVAFRITGDSQTAQECENDTYLQAWNLIPPNEPREYLIAFLSRIVRNISIDRCIHENRKKRKGCFDEVSLEVEQMLYSENPIEKEINRQVMADAISSFLRKQSKEKRLVFMRRYYNYETVALIAKDLGCKENRIYTLLHRMRKELHTYLIQEKII